MYLKMFVELMFHIKEYIKRKAQLPLVRTRPAEKRKVFGVSLRELGEAGLLRDGVPLPVRSMVEFLREHALQQVGLFRIPGDKSAVAGLRLRFESGGEVDPLQEGEACDMVASSLKEFLRDVPGGLITASVKPGLLQLCQECGGDQSRAIKEILQQLPDLHYDLLKYLCLFLTEVSRHQDNRMKASDLAIAFGPSIFHVSPVFDGIKEQNKILEKLIQNYSAIFESDVNAEDPKENCSNVITVKEPGSSEELPLCSLQLMQRKKQEEENVNALRMQEQAEETLLSVEEHKENLQKTVQRMEECKEDFTEFLKIKDADQQGALRKAKYDKQLIAEREVKVFDLDEEIRELKEEREQLGKRVQRYAVYSQYMDTLVQATNIEALRVISRFKTLVLAREYLREITHQGQEKIREARADLDSVTQESRDAKMLLTGKMVQYQRQLDEAIQNRLHWDRTWNNIQKSAASQTIFFGTIRMACWNVYRNVCERSQSCRENPVHPEDTEGQLAMIETFITHWISALKM